MKEILIVIHVLVSIFLIIVVLLQTGKGADIGAVFGGGTSQTLFGSAGPGGFLAKLTTIIAIIFMLTSLLLAYWSGKAVTTSTIMEEGGPRTEQAIPAPPLEEGKGAAGGKSQGNAAPSQGSR